MSNGEEGVVKIVRSIPPAVWIAVLAQVVGFGVWLVRMDNRITENGKEVAAVAARLNDIDLRDTRAGVLVSQRVYQIERTIEWLVAAQTGIRPPAHIDPAKPPPGYRPEDKKEPTTKDGSDFKLQSEESKPYEFDPAIKEAMPPPGTPPAHGPPPQ